MTDETKKRALAIMARYPNTIKALGEWEPAPAADDDPRSKMKKHQYWLPDTVDTKPTYAWDDDKKPNRESKFARDFDGEDDAV